MGNIFENLECFGIDISIVDNVLDLGTRRKTLRRQDAGAICSINDPIVINADPFLFVHENRLFLFYEETTFRRPGGRLMMVSSSDLNNWTAPVQISREDNLHFSFPFVFRDGDDVYMIPETGWSGEIRLYRAKDSGLNQWEADTVLMRRGKKDVNIIFDYADNVVYKKDDVYYLFTSILDKDGYRLLLFTSPNLRGPYDEHPCSPVCHDLMYGRNAGSLIEFEGKLYRPTQDCSQTYGGQVNLMEIVEITPLHYEEKVYSEHVLPQSTEFYRFGGHQLNFVTFKGLNIVATDAKRDRCFPVLRIVDKIKRIVGLKK